MLVLSCGGTDLRGSQTFTSEVEAYIFNVRKKFEGYKTSIKSNDRYNTHIVFYSKE